MQIVFCKGISGSGKTYFCNEFYKNKEKLQSIYKVKIIIIEVDFLEQLLDIPVEDILNQFSYESIR